MPQRGFRRLVDVAEKWDGQAALTLIAGGDFFFSEAPCDGPKPYHSYHTTQYHIIYNTL